MTPKRATRDRYWTREQALAWIATRNEQLVRTIGARVRAPELHAEPGMMLAISLALHQTLGSAEFGEPVSPTTEMAERELARLGAGPYTPKAVKVAWPPLRGRGRPAGKTLPRDRLVALARCYLAERCDESTVEQHARFCAEIGSIDMPEFRRLRALALDVAAREIDAGERLGLLTADEVSERRDRLETWKPRAGRPPGRKNVRAI